MLDYFKVLAESWQLATMFIGACAGLCVAYGFRSVRKANVENKRLQIEVNRSAGILPKPTVVDHNRDY